VRGPQKQPTASSARSLGRGTASMSFKISSGWVFGLCTVWVSGISKSSAGSSVTNFILRAVLKMVLILENAWRTIESENSFAKLFKCT
jgi:hypothetical protein